MKMNFKKLLTVVAAICIVAGVGMAVDWSKLDNLAKGKTVIVSSRDETAKNITDDKNDTRWQAIKDTHDYTHDWFIVDLGEVTDFNTIEIKWENSHPSKYRVFVSEDVIPYTEGTTEGDIPYKKIDNEWLENATPVTESTIEGEGGYTDELSVVGHGQYVLVYADEYNNNGKNYGISPWEIRIANVEGLDKASTLQLNGANVYEGESVNITVVPFNVLGEALSIDKVTDLALKCSDPSAVEITANENGFTVKALKSGIYTLTATAMAGDVEVTGKATLKVEYNWETVEKIDLTGCDIKGRHKDKEKDNDGNDVPVDFPHPAELAIDGNLDTYYEYNGVWAGGESWLLIDLGKEYMIERVGVVFGDNSNGKTKISYAVEYNDTEGNLDNPDFKWTSDNAVSGFTSTTQLSRDNNFTLTYAYPERVHARYIAIRDSDNPGGKPQIKEIYLKGEVHNKSVATTMDITVDPIFVGETTDVNVSIYDQYGEVFTSETSPEVTVEGANYADGKLTGNVKGEVKITASYGELTVEKKIKVADVNDYCMSEATITSDMSTSNPSAAIDGGSNPENTGGLYVVAPNGDKVDNTHWILADLHKPYNLDMIIAIWEGACPADYDVYVGKTEDDLQKLYSVTGHKGMSTTKDRFGGKEMDEVQFIKIVTTKNATGYGIKLYDLKAYGVSSFNSTPATVEVTADINHIATDETVTLTSTVLDQFGTIMPDLNVEFNVPEGATLNGDKLTFEQPGKYTVTASYNDLVSEPIEINVAAHKDTKLTPAHTATLSGAPYNKNAMTAEVQFDVDQPLEITFVGANYDFTLIRLRWEAACPSHYKVEATYKDGSKATIFSVEDRSFKNGFNPTDRIVHNETGDAENGIQHIHAYDKGNLTGVKKLTITPTAKDHEYTMRLFGIDTYGEEKEEVLENPALTFSHPEYWVVTGGSVNVADVDAAADFDNWDNITYKVTDEDGNDVEGFTITKDNNVVNVSLNESVAAGTYTIVATSPANATFEGGEASTTLIVTEIAMPEVEIETTAEFDHFPGTTTWTICSDAEAFEIKLKMPEGASTLYYKVGQNSNEDAGGNNDNNNDPIPVRRAADDDYISATGDVTIPLTKGSHEISFYATDGDSKTSPTGIINTEIATGVREVLTDGDGEVKIFTLQGVRVKNPERGIYILVKDGKAKKVQF